MERANPTEVRSDEVHRRVAARIRQDPAIIRTASARLERWIGQSDGAPNPVLLEWRAAIRMLEPEELAGFLESTTPRARRLRVSSPFFDLGR